MTHILDVLLVSNQVLSLFLLSHLHQSDILALKTIVQKRNKILDDYKKIKGTAKISLYIYYRNASTASGLNTH